MTAEQRLRDVEQRLREAQAIATEKRRAWRNLIRGAWTPGDAYEEFVVASIAYASAADQETELSDLFEDALGEAQAEQLRRELEQQPA